MKPQTLTASQIKAMVPKRPADSHKGQNGHVVVLAGSRGMSGAAALTVRGALRIGAGLVTAAIVESERSGVTQQLPEALTLGLPETHLGVVTENALSLLLDYFQTRPVTALAIGPGLAVNAGVARLVKALLKAWQDALVLDADGLNNVFLGELQGHPKLIITPHIGEMARLIRTETRAVKADPIYIAETAAREIAGVCLLKGHPTILTTGSTTVLSPTGNQAMATGGMGDVLTGTIAGLLAQGLAPWEAACAGAYLHGLAGDLVRTSDRGLLATDVADALPQALAKIGVK